MDKELIDNIIKMVNDLPNDQELGFEVRKEISKYKERIQKRTFSDIISFIFNPFQ